MLNRMRIKLGKKYIDDLSTINQWFSWKKTKIKQFFCVFIQIVRNEMSFEQNKYRNIYCIIVQESSACFSWMLFGREFCFFIQKKKSDKKICFSLFACLLFFYRNVSIDSESLKRKCHALILLVLWILQSHRIFISFNLGVLFFVS